MEISGKGYLPSEVKFNQKERIFLKDLFEKVELYKLNKEEKLLINKTYNSISSENPMINLELNQPNKICSFDSDGNKLTN